MPFVSSDLAAALTTNFRTLWADQFLAAQNKPFLQGIRSLAMEVPSTTLIENYSWMGTVPTMREWVDERVLASLPASTYSITNRHYEATLEVDKDAIQDDRLGIYRPRIAQLAQEAARYPVQLISDVLIAGNTATGLAYDGQQFFDTDHVTPGAAYTTAQSNKLTGTGTTLAQITADFEAARAAMMAFKDDQGRLMGIMPTHVVIPPGLLGVFRQFLNAGLINNGQTNIWTGVVDIIEDPYLTDANDWYLVALDQPVKPLILQTRQAPEFAALDDPNTSETTFMRNRLLYGVDARWGSGYGLWQLAILTTNT